MTNTDLLASREAVLQTAISLLEKEGGSASLTQIYKGFSAVLGKDLTENEAENVRRIIVNSSADQCLLQKDGKCLYINSANDQQFHLEENKDKPAAKTAATADMSQALDQNNKPVEMTVVPENSKDPVIVTSNVVKTDSAAGKEALKENAEGPKDIQADVQADVDAALNHAYSSEMDETILDDAQKLDAIDKKIADEEAKIKMHEAQIEKDRFGLTKDIHKAEIHHDEKVLAREKEKAQALSDTITQE